MPGRLTRWKGQLVFIEALAQLPDRNFEAVMVGDAQERDAYVDELRARRRSPEPRRKSCASPATAATCRPPSWPPTSSSRRRSNPKPSAASPSKRKRWVARSSPRASARKPKPSSTVSPASCFRRATPMPSPKAMARALALPRRSTHGDGDEAAPRTRAARLHGRRHVRRDASQSIASLISARRENR